MMTATNPDGTITRNKSRANSKNALNYAQNILGCHHDWYPLN